MCKQGHYYQQKKKKKILTNDVNVFVIEKWKNKLLKKQKRKSNLYTQYQIIITET